MKTIMKTLLIIVSVLLLFVQAQAGEFWTSRHSTNHQYPDCSGVVKFENAGGKIKTGYMPCNSNQTSGAYTPAFNGSACQTVAQHQTKGIEERRGCCSWHGGVCGCDAYTGRAICCDGKLSPSCGCQ